MLGLINRPRLTSGNLKQFCTRCAYTPSYDGNGGKVYMHRQLAKAWLGFQSGSIHINYESTLPRYSTQSVAMANLCIALGVFVKSSGTLINRFSYSLPRLMPENDPRTGFLTMNSLVSRLWMAEHIETKDADVIIQLFQVIYRYKAQYPDIDEVINELLHEENKED